MNHTHTHPQTHNEGPSRIQQGELFTVVCDSPSFGLRVERGGRGECVITRVERGGFAAAVGVQVGS